jgi:cytoskeleton-associated protein 5
MNSLFGPKTISIKPVLAILPKIFAHSDSNVRAEGTLLAVALHCYLGPALTQSLSELKPLQVKELGDKFTEADGKGEGFGGVKQSRFTKSQQKAREVKQAAGPVEGVVEEGASDYALFDTTIWADQLESPEEEVEEVVAVDPFEFVEPAAILDVLPADFYTHLASTKWKDRKDLALDPLLTLLKASPRIKNVNFDELARGLAGRMTDANVVCVAVAANCIEALALGLRTDFGKYRSIVVPPLLERTKEKKTSVLDALSGALDATFLAVRFSFFLLAFIH